MCCWQKVALFLSCLLLFGCNEGNSDSSVPGCDGGTCDGTQSDKDGDGVVDEEDNCPDIPNEDQTDTDNDTIGDACEVAPEPGVKDKDGDGIADDKDNCPDIPNEDQTDTDNDTIGDACDDLMDKDGDGIADDKDNCPDIPNEDQKDTDKDGIGDVCDDTPNGTGTPMDPYIITVDDCSVKYMDSGDTSKSKSSIISKYPLFEDKFENGPEYYYKIEVKNRSRLNVYINRELDIGGVIDVDIHLLSSLDPNEMNEKPGTLMARNDHKFTRMVDPGTYYIVVDSFENHPGPYELHVEVDEVCGQRSSCDNKCFTENSVNVGIWFSVWYAYLEEYSDSVQVNTWTQTHWGPSINYRPLLSTGKYGMYDSINETEINYFISELSDVGVDFIIMDETNHINAENGYINARAIATAKVIQSFIDKNPNRRPVKYMSAIGAMQWSPDNPAEIENEAEILWHRYENIPNGISEKYHYYLDGKPLLIVYCDGAEKKWEAYKGSKTYASKFTLRWADNGSVAGYYGWAYEKGTKVNSEVEVVMPGWNNNAGHTPVNRNGGRFYRDSINTVLDNPLPKTIVINSFNEYAERTSVWPALTDNVIDDDGGNKDKWYNADISNPVLKPTMYWDMTRNFLQEVRGRD